MNKERRKAIAAARADLDKIKSDLTSALEGLDKIKSDLTSALEGLVADYRARFDGVKDTVETLRDEEQEYHDNMPESFQSGEKGDVAQAAVDVLDEVASDLDSIEFDAEAIVSDLNLDDILSKLEDAEQ